MLTEDLQLPSDGSWIAIVPLDVDVIVHNASNRDCMVRLGALSTSYGMLLEPGITIMVSETIYVRAKKFPAEGSIRVTR